MTGLEDDRAKGEDIPVKEELMDVFKKKTQMLRTAFIKVNQT